MVSADDLLVFYLALLSLYTLEMRERVKAGEIQSHTLGRFSVSPFEGRYGPPRQGYTLAPGNRRENLSVFFGRVEVTE